MLEVIQESKNGLVIPSSTTLDQWLAIGEAFTRAADKLQFMIGDWLAYGADKKWGDKYTDAAAATGIDPHVLKQYRLISSSIQMSTRVDQLTWSHHRAVAALDAEAQSYWLGLAVEHKLSERELIASIDAGKIVRIADLQAERASKAGLGSPQAVRMAFLAAIRQATNKRDVQHWPKPMRDAWKIELDPIIKFYAQL